MTRLGSPDELAARHDELAAAAAGKKRVLVCSTGCLAIGARDIEAAFREGVADAGLEDEVEVVATGCHGLCAMAPVVLIEPDDVFYGRNRAKFVPDVIAKTVQAGEIVTRLTYGRDEATAHLEDIPFFDHQTKRVLRNVGRVDPQRIEDAIARGVYGAVARMLSAMQPDEVIEEVKTSAIRGRGGGGFPVWRKWEICRGYTAEERYLICNADEGDPGAFMDRALLEGDPHSVIEGMIIAAFAIEATRGYVYVRAEYPIAVRHIRLAIDQAQACGLLGDDILGSGFSFDIEVREGAGAFVCGEDSALIASHRGPARHAQAQAAADDRAGPLRQAHEHQQRRDVRQRPAHHQRGRRRLRAERDRRLEGHQDLRPRRPGEEHRPGRGAHGRHHPRDRLRRRRRPAQGPGVQGGADGRAFGRLRARGLPGPAHRLRLAARGRSHHGIGRPDRHGRHHLHGRYGPLLHQLRAGEGCGSCAPCRLGTVRLEQILDRICAGDGTEADLDTLERLADVVRSTTLCGLGQTAPNPVLSTLHHFRDEYHAHVVDKTCPAGVCKALTAPEPVLVGSEA